MADSGFYSTWTIVRDSIISTITAAKAEYPSFHLVITGHSLGGIQATLAAAELRSNGTGATLFTYGTPHVGDEAFAEHVSNQGNNFRITHTNDYAPQMEDVSLGYRHVSPEYWIYEDRNEEFEVVRDQVKIAWGTDSREGNQVCEV